MNSLPRAIAIAFAAVAYTSGCAQEPQETPVADEAPLDGDDNASITAIPVGNGSTVHLKVHHWYVGEEMDRACGGAYDLIFDVVFGQVTLDAMEVKTFTVTFSPKLGNI